MAFEDGEGVLTIDTKDTRSVKTDALSNSSYEDRKFDYFYDCPIEYLYLGRDLKYDYSDETDIYDLVDNTWKQVKRVSAPFANSTTLEEVEIGPKVTFVYNHLCHNCDKLASVVSSVGLQNIYSYAFADCDKLISLSFPASLQNIYDHAFVDCDKLTSIAFPASLQNIYDYAFADCDELTSTAFSVGLQKIYNCAFTNCPKLASTTFEESSDHTLIIDESAFRNCVSLENVTFPGQLSILANYAYSVNVFITIEQPKLIRNIRV